MQSEAVLALDAGTSSAKALLVALGSGEVLARAAIPVALQVPALAGSSRTPTNSPMP